MIRTRLLAIALAGAGATRTLATDWTVTSNADDGSAGTLRSIVHAATTVDNDRILFAPGVTSIALATTNIVISDALQISGNGVVINGNGANRVFLVAAGATDNVTLSGLVITNGYTTAHGGGIYADLCGTLTLTNCTLAACQAQYGGGLKTDEGVALYNCRFVNNTATGQGGGIHADTPETLAITGGLFAGNVGQNGAGSTYRGGGAIGFAFWQGCTATIRGGTVFTNNQSLGAYHGGAIYAGGRTNGVVDIEDAVFANNSAPAGMGGAIGNFCSLRLRNCLLRGNTAYRGGAGVANAALLTATGCRFLDNSVAASQSHTYYGGAIGVRSSNPTVVSNCLFRGNSDMTVGGGAIGTYPDNVRVACYFSHFEGNRASDGGAIRTQDPLDLYGCTFITNTCSDDGAAVMIAGTTGLVANCTFYGNVATDDGAAVCGESRYRSATLPNYQPVAWIYNSTICSNRGDGAIRVNRTTTEPRYCSVYSSIVSGNYDGAAKNDLEGDYVNVDHCLIGEPANSGYTVSGSTAGTTNGQDPLLGPLADNGGPALPPGTALLTCAIPRNSPAFGTGSNPLALLTDQRGAGYTREYPAAAPDIGAFEFIPPRSTGTALLIY